MQVETLIITWATRAWDTFLPWVTEEATASSPHSHINIRKAPSPFPSNHRGVDKIPVARFTRPTLRISSFSCFYACVARHLVIYTPEKPEKTRKYYTLNEAPKICRCFLFTFKTVVTQLEFPWSQILGTALSTQRLEQSLELPRAGAGEETFVSAEPFL